MGIFALLSFLPTEEQGREGRLAGGGLGRRLGARGKREREERGSDPGRGLGRGGPRRPGHEGGWR